MGNLACLAFAPAVRLFCNCQASSSGLLRSKQVAPGAIPLPPKKHGFMSTFHASRFTVHGTYKQVSLEAEVKFQSGLPRMSRLTARAVKPV